MTKLAKEDEGKKAITILLSPDLYARTEALAKKGDIKKAKLIQNLVELGVTELEAYDRWGMILAVRVFEELKTRVKELGKGFKKNGVAHA